MTSMEKFVTHSSKEEGPEQAVQGCLGKQQGWPGGRAENTDKSFLCGKEWLR